MIHVLQIAMPFNVPQANTGCLLKMDGNLEYKQMYGAPSVQKSQAMDSREGVHLSVRVQMRAVGESGPGDLDVEAKVGLNALSPLMCLVCMGPGDQLNGACSLQDHSTRCSASYLLSSHR